MRTVQQYFLPDGTIVEHVSHNHRSGQAVFVDSQGRTRQEFLNLCKPAGTAVRFGAGAKLVSSVLTCERLLPTTD